jgi:hypothetical protein
LSEQGSLQRPSQRMRRLVMLAPRQATSRLRKNSDFDLVLKGRGFSRAVNAAKSIAALAAAGCTACNPSFSAIC